jgi:hypothetical protein
MPSFLHPALFWTLGLPTLGVVALPVLIHLINMMRHRRVDWAAMEFLLLSQKKNRTWVMLKQLLLLLLRMLAVAAVVFVVAQPLLRNQWGNLLHGTQTHHIVLLDDSFSMSDRWADTDAFSEAKKVVERLGAEAARQVQPQAFTLLRFSQAGQFQRRTQPDLLKQPVGAEFVDKLNQSLAKLKVTQTAAGPIGAIQAIGQLLGSADGERRVVYVVSDFRVRQWGDPTDLRKELQQLNEAEAEIHLVNCIDKTRPNLAIASLAPADGIRAAGVPWFMEVAVQNFGPTVVREVPVLLSEDGHARPAVTLAEIPPGRVVKERFLVHFPNAGPHQIEARLDGDAVAADNYRYGAIELPADVPVLLIDGDARAYDARFLNWALAPGGAVRTGIRPQIETPRYLSLKPLDDFHVICLANIERLEKSAIDALEKFVAGGGGAAFFLGEHSQGKFFNDALYRGGQGLFPAPLGREAELLVDRLEPAPDVQVDKHFIFRVFAEKRNTFLPAVTVQRYFAVAEGWQPPPDSTVRVVARLRNAAPLVVERGFGKGRVMAFLTTAAPAWNNWARNPSFVVAMQDLQAYLARRAADEGSRLVGAPLEVTLDPARYKPQVRFVAPDEAGAPNAPTDAVRNADGMLQVSLPDTDASGFYEARLTRTDETPEVRHYAINVDPGEGELAALDAQQLAPRLEGVKYQYEQAAALQFSASESTGYNFGETLLYLLILLLIGEQVLAWSASYHPAARRGALAQGGAA